MSFTNGKPFVATEEHCKLPWGLGKEGSKFRCTLCGYKFMVGDIVRWQFTNDVAGASGNPLLCKKCDGTKEEIVNKMVELRKEFMSERFWSFRRE